MRMKLRQVREHLLVTQAELARRSGITRASISRLENGLQSPKISTVHRLAEALGVEPEAILDRPRRRIRRTAPPQVMCSGLVPPWEPETGNANTKDVVRG